MEGHIEILGFVAGLIYSISVLPQIVKIIRRKEARAISTATYLMQLVGLVLWFVYGMVHDLPLFLFWTAISIGLVIAVLTLKLFVWKG